MVVVGTPTKLGNLPPAQRRRVLVATASIAAVLLLWPWLSLLTSAAYCLVWWQRPEVHWTPTPQDFAGNASQFISAVPKVIHQTWQTTEVPAKWAAARQSCIDLHPDYEHRLWTDADGLEFIVVSKQGNGWSTCRKRMCRDGACRHATHAAAAASDRRQLSPAPPKWHACSCCCACLRWHLPAFSSPL